MPRWNKQFHPLDFIVIDFMQVNDCEGRRRKGATWTVHSKGRTREDGMDDGGGDWGAVERGEVDDGVGWGG